MSKKILFVVVLTLVIAGCVEETGRPNLSSSPNATQATPTPNHTVTIPTATPTATTTDVPASTPTPVDNEVEITTTSQPESSESWPPENPSTTTSSTSRSTTDLGLETGKKYDVTVTEVVEGDVVTVMFPDGGFRTVKLLGVEVPEAEPTNNQPHVYREITDLRCLADVGRDAKQFVNSMLVGENCSIELDQTAGLRENGMLLCYVYNGGDFNERLLEEGYALASDSDYSKKQDYMQIQNEEAQKEKGLWKCKRSEELSSLTVGFYEINNDPMGDDVSNLNEEYIVLKNYGNSSIDLYNWTLRNSRNESYDLPHISVYPGGTITLHSGSGVDTESDYYLGSSSPIWANQHDSAYLYNSGGKLADYCRW